MKLLEHIAEQITFKWLREKKGCIIMNNKNRNEETLIFSKFGHSFGLVFCSYILWPKHHIYHNLCSLKHFSKICMFLKAWSTCMKIILGINQNNLMAKFTACHWMGRFSLEIFFSKKNLQPFSICTRATR